MSYKKDNTATVVLGHKTRTYKGEEYHNFSGVLNINGKDYLLSIQSDGDGPKLYESKNDGVPLVYLTARKLGDKKDRLRRNQLR